MDNALAFFYKQLDEKTLYKRIIPHPWTRNLQEAHKLYFSNIATCNDGEFIASFNAFVKEQCAEFDGYIALDTRNGEPPNWWNNYAVFPTEEQKLAFLLKWS